ncbi:MAG: hypothetical protein ACI9KN_002581 [Gammaproteobacteria bacterium]|jgi:hypothetical protein
MKTIGYFTLVFLTMSLISCSSGVSVISNDAAAVSTPASLAGKTYRVTVESGSGVYATTGTFTVTFSGSQPTYTTIDATLSLIDSRGSVAMSTTSSSTHYDSTINFLLNNTTVRNSENVRYSTSRR